MHPPLVDHADLPELDPRVWEGVDHFNNGDYFEAHEAIEAAWLEEWGAIKPFYQGLIQVAVSLHHLNQNNLHGALKLWRTSTEHLLPFGEVCKGIHVGKLLREMNRIFMPITHKVEQPPAPMPIIEVEPGARPGR